MTSLSCAVVCPAPPELPIPAEIDPLSDQFSLAAAQEHARTRAEEVLELAGAAAAGADIVVLPENMHGLRHFWRSLEAPHILRRVAEPVPGPTTRAAGKAAKRARTMMVVTLYELEGSRIYSTAVVIGPRGKVLLRYRKVHVPHGENWLVAPGTELPTVTSDVATFGVLFGDDLLVPESALVLARAGAEVLLCPSARPLSDALVSFRARDHGCAVVAANSRASYIADCNGRLLAQSAGRTDFILAAELEDTARPDDDRDALETHLTGIDDPRYRRTLLRQPRAYQLLAERKWPEAAVLRKKGLPRAPRDAYAGLADLWRTSPAHVPDWEF